MTPRGGRAWPHDVDQERTIADLAAVWSSIDGLLAELDDDAVDGADVPARAGTCGRSSPTSSAPSRCCSASRRRPSRSTRPSTTHVRNDMGRLNEAWVVSMHAVDTRPSCWQRLADHAAPAPRRAAGDGPPTAWDAEGFTPAGPRHLRAVHAHPRVRLLAPRAGHPRRGRSPRPRAGSGRRRRARRDVDGDGLRRRQEGGRARRQPGDARAHRATAGGRSTSRSASGRPSSTSCPASRRCTLTMPTGVFTRLAAGRVDAGAVRDQVDDRRRHRARRADPRQPRLHDLNAVRTHHRMTCGVSTAG